MPVEERRPRVVHQQQHALVVVIVEIEVRLRSSACHVRRTMPAARPPPNTLALCCGNTIHGVASLDKSRGTSGTKSSL